MAAARISRAFAGPRKGETAELRAMLVSQYAWERKEGIQKVIMAMTLGKDVSQLFPDVLKNIATNDLDQKKLVYLYLMNYAKSHPDLCILAVNTFVQDSEDPNPLIRALAIRTMGCVRVEKMVDYMTEPLRKTLSDESPYVRKTASICVAKLFDLNPAMCLEEGFLEKLQELVADPNPMVIANSITALAEIQEAAPETHALTITSHTLKKMLMALNECTEWGRITILTRLAEYTSADVKESEHICERVSPQFQHVNPGVVLAAIKVVFLHMRFVGQELAHTYLKKMAPPLVTLVSTPPEVQYVALRNIDLILQKQPNILSKELRVFFIKYNDPAYIKFQKLEIMVRLANDKNVDQLLAELKEYALEVDVDIVKRAVKAIGQVAIKIEEACEKCVNTLLELINTKVNYVVQEVIVVIKDIFRKYPGYEGIIPNLCQCIDDLDDPNARGSIIWIVGEYAEKITNAGDILAGFVDGFVEEFTQTQLQIITAVVKLFLKSPSSAQSQSLVQRIFTTATTQNDNPDVRDRAYVYWRLLSSNASIAQSVVLASKPPISTTVASLPNSLLDELLSDMGTLASVYHKPPVSFVGEGRFGADAVQRAAIEEQLENARENPLAAEAIAKAVRTGGAAAGGSAQANVENLLDIDFDGGAPASMQKAPAPGMNGLEGLGGTPQRVTSPAQNGGFAPPPAQHNALDDLMGLGDMNGTMSPGASATSPPPGMATMGGFESLGGSGSGSGNGNSGGQDILSGFEGLDLSGGNSQPPPPQQQLSSNSVPQVSSPQGQSNSGSQDLLDLL